MSLIIIKRDIHEIFKDVIFEEITSAKDFLAEIEKRFAKKAIGRKLVFFFRV